MTCNKIKLNLDIVSFSFVFNISDTAAVYRNEADIGRSLKELLPKYRLTRKDVFITSKLCES